MALCLRILSVYITECSLTANKGLGWRLLFVHEGDQGVVAVHQVRGVVVLVVGEGLTW